MSLCGEAYQAYNHLGLGDYYKLAIMAWHNLLNIYIYIYICIS